MAAISVIKQFRKPNSMLGMKFRTSPNSWALRKSLGPQEIMTSTVRRVDLIAAVCRLPDELLVVLNPRKFLSVVEQNLAESA